MRWELLQNQMLSERLCAALVHSIWLVALIAIITWIVDRLVGRRAVERSYAIHVAALVASVMVLPITCWVVDTQGLVPPAEFRAVAPIEQRPLAAGSPNASPTDVGSVEAPLAPATIGSSDLHILARTVEPLEPVSPGLWATLAPWFAGLYLAGVAVMLVRLARGIWRTQRQGAEARVLREGPLVDMLHSLGRQWSMRIVPVLASTERSIAPKVIGLARPTILLPASAISGLSTDELELILAHELAHIRRHDMWVSLVQRLAEAVLFFNPAMWYLSRRVSLLREFCCDEAVCGNAANAGHEPHVRYARALLRAIEVGGIAHDSPELTSLAAAGRSPSELRRRIARLFGEPLAESIHLSRPSVAAVALMAFALLAGPAAWHTAAETPVQTASERSDAAADEAGSERDDRTPDSDLDAGTNPSDSMPPYGGPEILARVGTEYVLASDILPSVYERLAKIEGFKHAGKDKFADVQQQLVRKNLPDYIGLKLLYVHAKRTFPEEVFEDVRRRLAEAFEENELPKRLEALGLNSCDEYERQLARFGCSLEDAQRAFVERAFARVWLHGKLRDVSKEDTPNHIRNLMQRLRQEIPVLNFLESETTDSSSVHLQEVAAAEIPATVNPPTAAESSESRTSDSDGKPRTYHVDKKVSDYPVAEDFSTPEAAYATINRKQAAGPLDWKAVSCRSVNADLPAGKEFRMPRPTEEVCRRMLDARILEVRILGNFAQVAARWEGKTPPIDLRCFEFEGGRWLNGGNDRVETLQEAAAEFDRLVKWRQGRAQIQAPAKATPKVMAKIPFSPDQLELMGRVEWVMMHNFRDVTGRKTIEWGDVEKHENGDRSIRYKYQATIWDRDRMIVNQVFTFDPEGNAVNMEDVEGFPRKVEPKKVDTTSKEGMIALVEDFFCRNFRDITRRDDVKWGDVTKDKDGNSSIRCTYEATVWDRDKKRMDQIFTFTPDGKFVSVWTPE